jgi:hypothetical protein
LLLQICHSTDEKFGQKVWKKYKNYNVLALKSNQTLQSYNKNLLRCVKAFFPILRPSLRLKELLNNKNVARNIFTYLTVEDLSKFIKTSIMKHDETMKKYFEERKQIYMKLKEELKNAFIGNYNKYRELALQNSVSYIELEIPKDIIYKLELGDPIDKFDEQENPDAIWLQIRPKYVFTTTSFSRHGGPPDFYETNEFGIKQKVHKASADIYDKIQMEFRTMNALNNNIKTIKLKIEINNEIDDFVTVFNFKTPLWYFFFT